MGAGVAATVAAMRRRSVLARRRAARFALSSRWPAARARRRPRGLPAERLAAAKAAFDAAKSVRSTCTSRDVPPRENGVTRPRAPGVIDPAEPKFQGTITGTIEGVAGTVDVIASATTAYMKFFTPDYVETDLATLNAPNPALFFDPATGISSLLTQTATQGRAARPGRAARSSTRSRAPWPGRADRGPVPPRRRHRHLRGHLRPHRRPTSCAPPRSTARSSPGPRRPTSSRSRTTGSPLRSPAPRALLATAAVAVSLAAADTYVVVLALTDMMRGVGVGIDSLQRATPIISGFLLGYIAVLPLIGRLADLVDRQRVLLACLAVFVVGSAVTALAVELPVLVAGRVLQGVGGGGLVPATLAIVAQLWPADRRGVPLGVVGAVQELGSVLGPVLGAPVLVVADWRAIFWLNARARARARRRRRRDRWRPRAAPAPRAVALVVAGRASPGSSPWPPPTRSSRACRWGCRSCRSGARPPGWRPPSGSWRRVVLLAALAVGGRGAWALLRRADLLGALLLGGALGCVVLTFAAAEPGDRGRRPARLRAAAGGCAARRSPMPCTTGAPPSPLVPRGVVRGRLVWALVVSLLVGVALVAVIVDVPLLARLVHTSSQTVAALVLVRFLVAVPVGALAGGWALRRLGDGVVAAVGLALAAVGLAVMTTWGRGSLDEASSTVVLALTGLGIGLALAPVNDAALAEAPHDAHGTASALVVVARMVGMVVGHRAAHRDRAAPVLRRGGRAARPDRHRGAADAAVVQVPWVFRGAAVAAALGALASLALGLRRRTGDRPPRPWGSSRQR